MTQLLALSLLFTAIHLAEEVLGPGGPLWNSFGRIVGLTRIPWLVGFAVFTTGLGQILGLLSCAAYGYDSPWWLSVLFGARVGDSVISHWGLWIAGLSRPNPGIWSTALYMVEAVWILALADLNWIGVLLGAGAFAAVLPSLDFVCHQFFPEWI